VTPLTRKITRLSAEAYLHRSKLHRMVVTLYPAGIIGLRLEKTRREEALLLPLAYETAVRARIAFERKAKRKGGAA
jgi:hypothetical protein